jgi:hypothetical protein
MIINKDWEFWYAVAAGTVIVLIQLHLFAFAQNEPANMTTTPISTSTWR